MKIQAPSDRPKSNFAPIALALIALAVLGSLIIAAFYSQKPNLTSLFEVQSFAGKTEVSSDNGATWKAPGPGHALELYSWLKTGPDGEADLRFGKSTFARVKENTLFQIQEPQVFGKAAIRVHLEKGTLLFLNKGDEIEISVPGSRKTKENKGFFYDLFSKFVASSETATFLVSAVPEKGTYEVNVLSGEVQVRTGIPFRATTVSALHMVQGGGFRSKPISESAWKQVREAYELKPKSAASEAAQIDLSKKAGSFFNNVFDHGTFYQEKWGWCTREFFVPESTAEQVYMQADYDVFPKGSWVGVYFKTRGLDLSRFKGLKMDVKRVAGKSAPEYVRIELKSKYQVVRAFAIKMVKNEWETVEFPFAFSKEMPITEMTLLFSNDKVGAEKSGAVALKNFTLVPADAGTLPTPPLPAETQAAPAVSAPQAETPKI